MKTPNPDHPLRSTLKHLALASALGAAMHFGAAPANAAPPVTTGLKLHLDASALGLTDGATVDTWTDMSGLGNHATRTIGAPTYETNELNGKPVVRFPNGNGAYFSFPNMTDIRTVFWVIKEAPTGNLHFLMGHSSNYDFHRGDGGTQLWSNSWASSNIKNGTTKLNGPVVNGTTTNLPTGWNLVSLGTTGNVSANRLTQDRTYGRYWEGDIAEVLIYNAVLSPADELLVGGYLTEKYGLTTSYPPPNLAVTLTSPANNAAYLSGTSITATATVAAGTSPYNVKFFTRSLPGGTFAQVGGDLTTSPYTLDLGALSNGSYEIKATVTDSAGSPATATSATNTFTVASAIATTTTLAPTAGPKTYGDSVTFTATVAPAPSGGTVQFKNGGSSLGTPVAVNPTTGVASYTTTTLGAATHQITAEYSGYQVYEPSTTAASISQVVNKAPLTVAAVNMFRLPNTANPTFGYSVDGFKNGQDLGTSGVTGTPALTTTAVTSSPLGDYPITCAVGTLAAGNYSFVTFVNAILTVANVAAAFDVNSGSPTQAGYQGLSNTTSGSQNGVGLSATTINVTGSGYRDRGTGAPLATATRQALMRDFIFWNSDFTATPVTVTFQLTGLMANTSYDITYFTYNQGAFQQQMSMYKDSIIPANKLATHNSNNLAPDDCNFTFTTTSSASGTLTLIAVGDGSYSSVVFNGMMVTAITQSPAFTTWANGTFTPPLTAKLPTDNQDGDTLNNLQEFAFGTQPTVSTGGSISYVAGGAITATGLPVATNFAIGGGVDFRGVFGRRKDYVAAGLTYTPQFSVDMVSWTNSAATPTVLTGAGEANPSEIEAVSVPYPLFVPYTRDGIPGFEKPTFFRVGVSQP